MSTTLLFGVLFRQCEIFAGMKMLEERLNARDEAEHGEANYDGRGGGGNRGFGGGGH